MVFQKINFFVLFNVFHLDIHRFSTKKHTSPRVFLHLSISPTTNTIKLIFTPHHNVPFARAFGAGFTNPSLFQPTSNALPALLNQVRLKHPQETCRYPQGDVRKTTFYRFLKNQRDYCILPRAPLLLQDTPGDSSGGLSYFLYFSSFFTPPIKNIILTEDGDRKGKIK